MLYSQRDFVKSGIQLFCIHFIALFFILLNLVEYRFLMRGDVTPFFILMIIFFWSIYRPSLFHPVYIFSIGLAYDVFFNLYLGLHSFIFLFVYLTVSRQRIFLLGQNYLIVYLLFIMVAFFTFLIEFCFYALMTGALYDYMSLLHDFVFTILLFPLFGFFHIFLRNILIQQGDQP